MKISRDLFSWGETKKILFVITVLFLLFFGLSCGSSVTAPAQPLKGPGGKEYSFGDLRWKSFGKEHNQYWIFYPVDPKPEKAPVVVFLHGWGTVYPESYGAWIRHIVEKGNILIYPRFQKGFRGVEGKGVTANIMEAVIKAFASFDDTMPLPDLEKVAVIGHSAGGNAAPNFAALAKEQGLPVPKAIMSVEPGIEYSIFGNPWTPLVDLTKIDPDTLLLVMVGDKDNISGDEDAKKIFNRTKQIPLKNKDYITLVSDYHGSPKLKADHYAGLAMEKGIGEGEQSDGNTDGSDKAANETDNSIKKDLRKRLAKHKTLNAHDYYGIWKLFDALCEAAFYGKNRDYALGNTKIQRYMGEWSDGIPVKELVVTDTP